LVEKYEQETVRARGYLVSILVTESVAEANRTTRVVVDARDPETGERLGEVSPDEWDVVGSVAEPKDEVVCLPIFWVW
jgi:hypothetical protein